MLSEDSLEFAFSILDTAGSGEVPRQALEPLLDASIQLALQSSGLQPTAAPDSARALAAGMLTLGGQTSSCLALEGFRAWSRALPGVRDLLGGLLMGIGSRGGGAAAPGRQPPQLQLPQLDLGGSNLGSCLLQPEWLWLLSQALSTDLRQEWRLLFSSARNGMSFSTMVGRLGEAAPTLLLVRDKGGALFGGVAHQPWGKHGSFYGDSASTIFSLLPNSALYPATGINANLQWCGLGFKELPNGIGFGGQVGNFGLYLDSTLDKGHSRPCATFANPCLSSEVASFETSAVECWLLKPPPEEPGGGGSGARGDGGSVLSKAKEDRQILEWAGVRGQGHSAGIRDEPLDED